MYSIVFIKYMAKTDEVYASVKQLADTIKVLPGVKSVAILMHNGKKITMDGKKLLFQYEKEKTFDILFIKRCNESNIEFFNSQENN